MGALSSGSRKRGDDHFSFRAIPSPYTPNLGSRVEEDHISKKPRFSSVHESSDRPVMSKSSASRIYRYPEAPAPLRREVHAPCRILKFGLLARSARDFLRVSSSGGNRGDIIGNTLGARYDQAKSLAIGALRFTTKEREVIDVEAAEEAAVQDVTDDSSIEELEVLKDGRKGPSTVSDHMKLDNGGAVINAEELDEKNMVDPILPPSNSSDMTELVNYRLEVENAEKMLSARLNDSDGVPIHKKLMKSAERRNSRLSSLSFQIELEEKNRSFFSFLHSTKKPEKTIIIPQEAFVPLTKEEENEIARSFSPGNRRKVLVTHQNSNIEITGEMLQCLRPGAWLNDEVINVYLELLKEREKRDPKKFLRCHFFNTFFYKKLISGRDGYDFKSVRRWTTQRKLGYSLTECDKIFVPIHKEIHWCLAVINRKDESFQYLDSLGGTDSQVLKKLARYFADEVKDKSGNSVDVGSWAQEFVEDLPEQKNGSDCGMFMIKYADFYSRGGGLCFNQENMPYFRLRTAKEILRLKAD